MIPAPTPSSPDTSHAASASAGPVPTVASSPSPLNIVHFLPEIRLADGGVVRAVLDWCAVFAARGHQVTLLAWNGQDIPSDWFTRHPAKPMAVLLSSPTRSMGRLGADALDRAGATIAA